jgi:hypothetical protein
MTISLVVPPRRHPDRAIVRIWPHVAASGNQHVARQSDMDLYGAGRKLAAGFD